MRVRLENHLCGDHDVTAASRFVKAVVPVRIRLVTPISIERREWAILHPMHGRPSAAAAIETFVREQRMIQKRDDGGGSSFLLHSQHLSRWPSSQAAVCKAAEAGAIPARDSISRAEVLRETRRSFLLRTQPLPVGPKEGHPFSGSKLRMAGQTGVQGAPPCCSLFSRDSNAGVGQDLTGLAAAVQLRLRVAFGLQALQRCSGPLNRRARGSTVATHHFADVAQERQQQFCKLPGTLPRESANLSIGSNLRKERHREALGAASLPMPTPLERQPDARTIWNS